MTAQHQSLLDELWQSLKAEPHVVWEAIGFQSADPKTDFVRDGIALFG